MLQPRSNHHVPGAPLSEARDKVIGRWNTLIRRRLCERPVDHGQERGRGLGRERATATDLDLHPQLQKAARSSRDLLGVLLVAVLGQEHIGRGLGGPVLPNRCICHAWAMGSNRCRSVPRPAPAAAAEPPAWNRGCEDLLASARAFSAWASAVARHAPSSRSCGKRTSAITCFTPDPHPPASRAASPTSWARRYGRCAAGGMADDVAAARARLWAGRLGAVNAESLGWVPHAMRSVSKGVWRRRSRGVRRELNVHELVNRKRRRYAAVARITCQA